MRNDASRAQTRRLLRPQTEPKQIICVITSKALFYPRPSSVQYTAYKQARQDDLDNRISEAHTSIKLPLACRRFSLIDSAHLQHPFLDAFAPLQLFSLISKLLISHQQRLNTDRQRFDCFLELD